MAQLIEGQLLQPGICVVCEKGSASEKPFVDTLRTFEPGVITKLTGRKYVCQECVGEFANLLGFASPDQAQEMQDAVEAAEAARAEAEARAAALEDVQVALGILKPKRARAQAAE